MSEETKKAIEELKAIRLELFRSAASLDEAIKSAEFFVESSTGAEQTKFEIRVMADYRINVRDNVYEWSDLKKREDEAWKKLIDSIKVEEES